VVTVGGSREPGPALPRAPRIGGVRPDWVFLDRDGTLNVSPDPHEYVTEPDELHLLPGAGEAVARLNRAGVWVGVVTNQRCVARGLVSPRLLDAIHRRLRDLLSVHGAHLDGVWVCPHADGECDCRKPAPGLLLQAQRAVPEIDFARSALVGDTDRDVGAGNAVGAVTVRLGTEIGDATHVAHDLAGAVELLLDGG
jgi:D-glycero-D-manno-heptose 1,7-bisphosphate phosphatase